MNEYEFNVLLKRIATDRDALAKLHAFYYRRIVYHVGKKYGRAFAEDVAQEFFLGLLRAGSFEHVTNPTTWVYLRCESIAIRLVQRGAHVSYRPVVAVASAEEWKEEMYGDLYEAVRALDETDQAIVDLYYWEGYRLREIATMLSLSEDVVRQRHRRLLKKIKKYLRDVTFLTS